MMPCKQATITTQKYSECAEIHSCEFTLAPHNECSGDSTCQVHLAKYHTSPFHLDFFPNYCFSVKQTASSNSANKIFLKTHLQKQTKKLTCTPFLVICKTRKIIFIIPAEEILLTGQDWLSGQM